MNFASIKLEKDELVKLLQFLVWRFEVLPAWDKEALLAEVKSLSAYFELEDEYFIERKLYPNVDFYSGIILKAMGIPTNMFTVIFAVSRTIGWISHWNEMLSESYKIGRPRQLYTGHDQRDYPSK